MDNPAVSPSVSAGSSAPAGVAAPEMHEPPSDLVCSAKGCPAHAEFGLRWNNPSLHTPERRKTWLACAEHREHLSQFLSARGFLREVVATDDLPQP